jgi:hypothetical protein
VLKTGAMARKGAGRLKKFGRWQQCAAGTLALVGCALLPGCGSTDQPVKPPNSQAGASNAAGGSRAGNASTAEGGSSGTGSAAGNASASAGHANENPAGAANNGGGGTGGAEAGAANYAGLSSGGAQAGATHNGGGGVTSTAGMGGTSTAGMGGTSTAGVGGTSTAGMGGTSTAGMEGTSTAGMGGTSTAGMGNGGGGAAGLAGSSGVNFCNSLPHFTGVQTVDGAGEDFAGIVPMIAKVRDLGWLHPVYVTDLDSTISLRVAWSEAALHAHVHVSDATVVAGGGSYHLDGDNVQFFIAGTATLTGLYTGTEDHGAAHLILTPPLPSNGWTGSYFFTTPQGPSTSSLPASAFKTRLVSDGYEVELQFPWPAAAEPRVSGAHVGFDVVVGASNTGYLQLESALANNPVPGAVPPQCGPIMLPGCDDRSWCLPTLAP